MTSAYEIEFSFRLACRLFELVIDPQDLTIFGLCFEGE